MKNLKTMEPKRELIAKKILNSYEKIRNSKSEIRNNTKFSNTQIQKFCILIFYLVSDFDIRISNFSIIMSFQKKSLPSPKRVCVRLKESRELKNMTLATMAERTHISLKYLKAMEECRFNDIPFGTIYQKNFLKRYAATLGLPPQPFIDQFIAEEVKATDSRSFAGIQQKKRLRISIPEFLRTAVLALGVIALVFYLGLQVKQSIDPPALSLYTPSDGFVTGALSIMVRGITEHETQLSINGKIIIPDNDGSFSEDLYLSPGINTITVLAKRKHGKTTSITRHVILKETQKVSLVD